MGTSWSDAAEADRGAHLEQAALTDALAEAEAIAKRFTEAGSAHTLRPAVAVDLDVGGDDQPLFVFSMDVDLDDDLAADDYPLEEIQELTSTLRSRIAVSGVDSWAWLVTAGTKAGAAH